MTESPSGIDLADSLPSRSLKPGRHGVHGA